MGLGKKIKSLFGGSGGSGSSVSAPPAPQPQAKTIPVVGAAAGTYDGGYSVSANTYISSISGIYTGSLSAQGNMVAMQVNQGAMLEKDAETYRPYLAGYIREYWRNPTTCTFGSDSAMPALTAVMPAGLKHQGNFNYYVDLQMVRLTGSNSFNFFYFINAYRQILNWVNTSNSYLASLKNSQNTNLKYYGFNSYDDMVTQGLNRYQGSETIIQLFNNLGVLVQSIPSGKFGTPNDVAKTLIDKNLGAIGNLSEKLYTSGVNYNDIYNPGYTLIITEILKGISNPSDLVTVQEVLETSVPNITTLLDYTSIVAVSGRTNDSTFTTLAEIGKDLYLIFPKATFTSGKDFVKLLTDLQNATSASVETISSADSLLTPEIINSLKSFLPSNNLNSPVTMLDVAGTASGYLLQYMVEVNEGMAQLLATPYGPRIRQVLTDISRYSARLPFTEEEALAADAFTPVPPPQYQTYTDPYGTPYDYPIAGTGGPDYWLLNLNKKIDEYYALLNELVADKTGEIPSIVSKINDNYYKAASLLSTEVDNFGKSNMLIYEIGDNSTIFNFVSSLPDYAVDRANVGTGTLLYGMAQDNDAGNLLKTILGQAKNSDFISNGGGRIKGVV